MRRIRLLQLTSLFVLSLSAFASPPRAEAMTEEDCFGGGPGASSCSYTLGPLSCSVTCDTGYACCRAAGCNCILPT